jgi:integral membrane sensor domain MASE1
MAATVEVFGLQLRPPAVALAYVALHFLAVGAGLALQIAPVSVAVYWPAAGTLLGALLLYPYRYWPGLLIAALVTEVAANAIFAPEIAPANASVLAIVAATEATIGAFLVRRLLGDRLNFARVNTVLVFGGAVAVTTFVGALVAAGYMVSSGMSTRYWLDQQYWWIGDLLGDLTLAPLVLTFGYFGIRPHRDRDPATDRSSLFAAVLLLCIAVVVFSRQINVSDSPLDTPYLLYGAWAVRRHCYRLVRDIARLRTFRSGIALRQRGLRAADISRTRCAAGAHLASRDVREARSDAERTAQR